MVGLEGYQPVKYGSVFRSCPGWDMRVLGANNEELPPGQFGDLCAKLPAPPGFMLTLYNKDDECVKTYFEKHPGYYDTSDAGTIDDDGYVSVMSRTDDIINVSGHRVSTGSVEEVRLCASRICVRMS
jgi:propionyl-CoA synthetase